MKIQLVWLLLYVSFVSCKKTDSIANNNFELKKTYIKLCIENNKITQDWRNVLTRRQSKTYLDSLEQVVKPLNYQEKDWFNLIESKADQWNQMKDSLKIPFGEINISDTTYIYLGYQGNDDGFTYKYKTVCLDLTALQKAYGSAKDSVNDNRIDRIFAHEYTHVLHKEWVRQHELELITYQDSILWECFYEGIGMYRSMSSKWLPINDTLSKTASETFEKLYPIFVDRLIEIESSSTLTDHDKKRLHKNLSRGSMKEKWGALPIGVWLALESRGDDKNLIPWIKKGPDAIVPLALKYLTGKHKTKFETTFKN